MRWIGLTGGIATGKSTAAKLLRDLGLPVIDADQLAREVVAKDSEGLQLVTEAFGEAILNDAGELDRKSLGDQIFADPKQRERLEKIVHPLIEARRAEERRRLEQEGAEVVFYDVPLLFEAGMQEEFDKVVLVYADRETQIKRLKERNDLKDEQIEKRLSSQLPIEEKKKRADFVVLNTGSMADLKNQLLQVVKDL